MNWRKYLYTQKIGLEVDMTQLTSENASNFGVGVQDAKKQYAHIIVVLSVYCCAIIVVLSIVLRQVINLLLWH